MPLLFFILSFTLLYYGKDEPNCMVGSIVFAALGLLFMGVSNPKKETAFRKKR
jgi:hypothetical protein